MNPSKDLQQLIARVAGPLGIGLLIGLERGWGFDVKRPWVSMARLTPDILSTLHAAVAILGAVASNIVGKIAIWSEQLRCGGLCLRRLNGG